MRIMPLLAIGFGLLVAGATLLSANTDEPDSAFSEPAAIVKEARSQDLETLRLLSGPQVLLTGEHDASSTLLVVLAPERPYTQDAAEAVEEFLRDGGRLLVADNFGSANSLTARLGITFERVRLVEEGSDSFSATVDGRNVEMPVQAPTAIHVDGVSHDVLAASTSESYLDRDGDGLVTAGEPLGPFPVLVDTTIGTAGGRVIALSDPSALLTDAEDGQAGALRQVLLGSLLPDGGIVIVDESQEASHDPWLFTAAAVLRAATSDPWRQAIAAIAVALLVLGTIVATRDRWGPHFFDVDRFVRRAELGTTQTADEHDAVTPVMWTRRGRAALLGGLVLAVFGLLFENEQATYAAAVIIVAGALAVWTGPARVVGRRSLDAMRIHEDGTTGVELSLRSTNRHIVEVEVLDELESDFELTDGRNWFETTLRPKKQASFRYEAKGALRGPHDIGPLMVRTSDVFHLRAIETAVQDTDEILVLPRNDPITRIPFQSKTPLMTLGPHLVNRAGDGTEFHSLRDYQTGDSIRIVNWKASARSQDLVVNQRVHESMARVTVFLDARALSGAGPIRTTPINEGCRAALSIVTGLLQARDKVRLFVYGEDVQEVCPDSGRDKSHQVGDILAGLEPRGRMTFEEAIQAVLPDLKARTPFVLISGLEDDATIMAGIRELRKRAVLPFVLAMELGTKPEEEAPEPGAHHIQEKQRKMIAELQSAEIPVLKAVPGMPLGTLFQVGLR